MRLNHWRELMNLHSVPSTGYVKPKQTTLETFLNELTDPDSVWYDLKVAEMSGCDYVFVPDAVCRQLATSKSVQIFLKKIHTILGSHKSRTVMISYWHDRYQQLHFERFNVQWTSGMVTKVSKALLDGNSQLDFIRMLFEHSEPLICTQSNR